MQIEIGRNNITTSSWKSATFFRVRKSGNSSIRSALRNEKNTFPSTLVSAMDNAVIFFIEFPWCLHSMVAVLAQARVLEMQTVHCKDFLNN